MRGRFLREEDLWVRSGERERLGERREDLRVTSGVRERIRSDAGEGGRSEAFALDLRLSSALSSSSRDRVGSGSGTSGWSADSPLSGRDGEDEWDRDCILRGSCEDSPSPLSVRPFGEGERSEYVGLG